MNIYNSKTRKIELFKERNPGIVNMYVCGPTVYSDIHIGNARPLIFFDIVKNYFELIGYKVNYVSNVTDIDDKIINKALELNITENELTKINIQSYESILEKLNIKFQKMPKVTDYINEILAYIYKLVELDYAYVKDSSVYFRVDKLKSYGSLSNHKLNNSQIKSRIEIDLNKEYEHDFILWKETKKGITFESNYGKGRPGWHSECCVMIDDIFKQTIDIHGGGQDLLFPHHENENAQCCALGNELSNFWMHNGYVNIDNVKMSKSIGNVLLVKDVLDKYDQNFLRILLLQSKYRSPINLNNEFFSQTEIVLKKLEKLAFSILNFKKSEKNLYIDKIIDIIKKDFNTSNLIDYLINFTKVEINEEISEAIIFGYKILGLEFKKETIEIPEEIKMLIEERNKSKSDGDYAKADLIRKMIFDKGYEIADSREGVTCRKIQ